jgi:hypothetical protein
LKSDASDFNLPISTSNRTQDLCVYVCARALQVFVYITMNPFEARGPVSRSY